MELEVENLNVNKICRTCLSVDEPLLDMFHQTEVGVEGKIRICDVLTSIAYVQIQSGDGLPEEICQSCMEKANVAYNFKIMCERSDTMLRKVALPHSNLKFDGVLHETLLNTNPLLEIKCTSKMDKLKDDKSRSDKLLMENFKDVMDDFHLNAETNELNLFHVSHISNKSQIQNLIEIEVKDCDDDIINSNEIDILKCDICLDSFMDKSQLDVHKKQHESATSHTCNTCKKTFNRISSLQIHINSKHGEYKAHLCPVCGERFHLAGGLRQHMKYHRGIKSHACDLCDKRYYNLHLLKEHIRCSHSNNRYSFSCSICNKKFTARSTLKMHSKIHTGERSHACETCGKKFTRATYLKVHMRKHTLEPPSRVFLCTYENCGRVFTVKASLDIHIRHKHTKERPYTCELCGKAFLSLPGVMAHRRIHVGDKPEECAQCGNKFVNKQSLKKHMRLHTGERPYRCSHCGECFLSSSRRSEHVQTKHMERQQECSICHKKFHLRRTLKNHMRVHTGEKRTNLKSISKLFTSNVNIPTDTKQNVPEAGFEVIV